MSDIKAFIERFHDSLTNTYGLEIHDDDIPGLKKLQIQKRICKYCNVKRRRGKTGKLVRFYYLKPEFENFDEEEEKEAVKEDVEDKMERYILEHLNALRGGLMSNKIHDNDIPGYSKQGIQRMLNKHCKVERKQVNGVRMKMYTLLGD